jgi:hypothetical protein
MESQEILSQASFIARSARANAERAEIEETVRNFEASDSPVLRSLARTYRLLQHPFK